MNEDIELMINNCLTYNYNPQSRWNKQGIEFQKYYELLWKDIESWHIKSIFQILKKEKQLL